MKHEEVALDAHLEHPAGRSFISANGTLGGDLPLVQDDHMIAGVLDVGQQMRRQYEADALVVGEVADELQHLVPPLGVHAVGGPSEKQQIRIVDQRLGELDALLMPVECLDLR